jgi:hypothetical protein
MAARNIRAPRDSITLGTRAREHIEAYKLIKRLQSFVLIDPDHPKPGEVRLTRTQAFVALALLKKILPDLANVEVSGNPDKPLMVQVVRFSDGEQLTAPRPIIDVTKLITPDPSATTVIEADDADADADADEPVKGSWSND